MLCWGRSGEIRALPYTGGWLPHGNFIKPRFFPLGYLCISRVGWGYGYQKLSWPGPQGPQPVGSKVQRSFVVVCFLGSSPVRGSGISQESGEVVASCWGFASPWPPSPSLITSPKGGMRWGRVGCLSLGIDSPPFYGPPLCPSDPVLYPHHARCVSLCMGHVGILSGRSLGADAEHLNPTTPRGRSRREFKLLQAPWVSV